MRQFVQLARVMSREDQLRLVTINNDASTALNAGANDTPNVIVSPQQPMRQFVQLARVMLREDVFWESEGDSSVAMRMVMRIV